MFLLKVFFVSDATPCSIYYKVKLNLALYIICVSPFCDLRAIVCKSFIRDFALGCNADGFLAPCSLSNSLWQLTRFWDSKVSCLN